MRHLQDEELVGLVFDELDGEERDTCNEHLMACPGCPRRLRRLPER